VGSALLKWLLFLLLINVKLIAQDTWSLERCIQHALTNNIQLKQSNLSVQLSRASLLQSKINLTPSLNAGLSQSYSIGSSIDPTTNIFDSRQISSNSFSLSSNITIWNGFRQLNTIKQKQYNYSASQSDVKKAENDLLFGILNAYLLILFSQEQVEIAKNQLDITKKLNDNTKILFEVGKVAEGDLLEIKAQLANEELLLVNAENDLELSILSLKLTLDLDYETPFSIEKPDINLLVDKNLNDLNPQEIYKKAESNQPITKTITTKVVRARYHSVLFLFIILILNYLPDKIQGSL